MTLGQAVRRVIQQAPRDTTGRLQNELLLVRDWVVARYRMGLNRHTWSFLQNTNPTPITTVANTDVYPLPTDFREFIGVPMNQTASNPVFKKPIAWIDRADPAKLQTGAPRFQAIYGGSQVKFYPIPDGAYTIAFKYDKITPDLVHSSDVILFPTFEWGINGATAIAFLYLGGLLSRPDMKQRAKQFEDDFEAQLQHDIDTDKPLVYVPENVSDQPDSSMWYSQEDIRSRDLSNWNW